MMLESNRYEKWERGGGGGGGGSGGGGGGGGGAWPAAARDHARESARERERQARAHQMSSARAAEPDASTLFPAPIRVTGKRDHVSQEIQSKLGDFRIAQTLLDDPSKSIGICAEPPSPAPCLPSRRESEFKKPSHAPQNGRIPHRPAYAKVKESRTEPGAMGAHAHRPPQLRIPNGYQHQSTIDSSQPPIESILKEMKSLPTPLCNIAATPRKELENKFIFNPHTNKIQENPQLSSNDLKAAPFPKPGLDNRISNSRSSVSPDVVGKDLGLSESDDEAATTRLHPILSPLGSGASPTSDSDSSHSESGSESSSSESAAPAPPPPADQLHSEQTTSKGSWYLSNFAPPPPPAPAPPYEAGKELATALADVKGKPSPISELSDSDASSSSPRRSERKPASPSSDDEPTRSTPSPRPPPPSAPAKRGRPPKQRASEERPAKKKRGRPPKVRPASPRASPHSDSEPEPPPPPPTSLDTKSHIFRKVFTPRKGDEGGGKGGKGGKGKGGKGKGQVTIIEVTAPDADADRRHRDRSSERRADDAAAERLSPDPRRRDRDRRGDRSDRSDRSERPERGGERERDRERLSMERLALPTERPTDRPDRPDRLTDRPDRLSDRPERLSSERPDRLSSERPDRLSSERPDRLSSERPDRLSSDRTDRLPDRQDRLSDRPDRLSDRPDRLTDRPDRLSSDKLDRLSDRTPVERRSADQQDRYVKAEADVGSGLVKSDRGLERLSESSVNEPRARAAAPRLVVRVSLARLRAETCRALRAKREPPPPPAPQPRDVGSVEVPATNHERTAAGASTPVYFSAFERVPDALSDDERDHKYYLSEAKRLRTAAEREQEPLRRVMLYLESVLCFVLTGRVLELELDTKRAFTIYRETIEYIRSIHSMPQRFRASPHSTFNKLDILSLRVQSLLYLRMFKMYNREVKEFHKIVQEYQQKPAHAESVSPLSPTPSPAGSVGSVGSASSGYCSLVHSVPASAHHALLQLTKYYTFLYVAHDLWEHSETLCKQRPNQDLFIAVDRKCGPLSLFSSFVHLVKYVRYAISLLKQEPRE